MKIAGISSKKLGDGFEGWLKNNNLYNDKELFDDADLNWYDYGFRNYDAQIGRFVQIDPLADNYGSLTPYHYAGNDPITNVDIDGLGIGDGCTLAEVVVRSTPHVHLTAEVVTQSGQWVNLSAKTIGKAVSITNKVVKTLQVGITVTLKLKIVSAGNEGSPNGYSPGDNGTEFNSNGARKGQIDKSGDIKPAVNNRGNVNPDIDFGIVINKKGDPVIRTGEDGKKHYISRQAATFKGSSKYNEKDYYDNPDQSAYPDGENLGYVTQNKQLKNAGVRKGDIGYVVSDNGSITYFVVSDAGEHGFGNIEVGVYLAQRVGAGPTKYKNGKWKGLTNFPTLKFTFFINSHAGSSLINPAAKTQEGLSSLGQSLGGPKANP